jgi:hypothetical protein
MISQEELNALENPGVLVNNQHLVESLQKAVVSAPRDAGILRFNLKHVIACGGWKDRLDTHRGARYRYDDFLKFITDPLPRGLAADPDVIREFIVDGDDLELLGRYDQMTQRGPGNPTGANQHTGDEQPESQEGGTVDNINDSSPPPRPTGTSRQQALRKLRTEAEKEGASEQVRTLYQRVLAGEISPHRGMVEAGFRKVPTPLDVLLRAWKRASGEERIAFLDVVLNQQRPQPPC